VLSNTALRYGEGDILVLDKYTDTVLNDLSTKLSAYYSIHFCPHFCMFMMLQVLLGSEQGVPMLVNLKNRRANNGVTFFDGGGRHFGPIAATHRHPVHDKFFLTVITLVCVHVHVCRVCLSLFT